jgi:hypothetical protein
MDFCNFGSHLRIVWSKPDNIPILATVPVFQETNAREPDCQPRSGERLVISQVSFKYHPEADELHSTYLLAFGLKLAHRCLLQGRFNL